MKYNPSNPIAILGMGARAPLGMNIASITAAVRAGISGFSEHKFMLDKNYESITVAKDLFLSEDVSIKDRLCEIAYTAIYDTLKQIPLSIFKNQSISIFLGLPSHQLKLNKEYSEAIVGYIQSAFSPHIKLGVFKSFVQGSISGVLALKQASELIYQGCADLCLVGSVDSYLDPKTLEWLDNHNRLYSKTNQWGFIPGEAAGFCLLSSERVRKELKMNKIGELIGVSIAEDFAGKEKIIQRGETLTNAVIEVLRLLAPEEKIKRIFCDMNGDRQRVDEFGFMLVRVSEYILDFMNTVTPCDRWGEIGVASGSLLMNTAIMSSLQRGEDDSISMICVNSGQETRGAIIVRACQKKC